MSKPMRTVRPLAVILAVVLVLLAGACTGGDSTAAKIEQAKERYGYDPDTATLTPAYAIVPEYQDPSDAYARDLLAAECLRGLMPYEAQRPSEGEFFDERTSQSLFDEDIARRWGYSAAGVDDAADDELEGAEITDEIHEKLVDCGEQADERLGSPPARPVKAVEDAGWAALESSDEVEAAYAAWMACMEPEGVVDLPGSPHEMPSRSVRSPGSLVELETGGPGDAELDRTVMPNEREIEVAVADARCREEADVGGIEFRVRVRGELEALARDTEAFEAARIEYQEYQRRVDEVIAEFGG